MDGYPIAHAETSAARLPTRAEVNKAQVADSVGGHAADAQLAVAVVTPADHAAVAEQRAGVVLPGRNRRGGGPCGSVRENSADFIEAGVGGHRQVDE
jgi:hypothetical protein